MDQLASHESIKPFCPNKDDNHHIENLLKDLWFYGNTSSSNPVKAMSGRSRENTYASIKRDGKEESMPPNLVQEPSLPPRANRGDREKKTLDEEIVQDDESEFTMGSLIRQAPLTNSESFPPRRPRNKGLTASSSISRHVSITKSDSGKLKGSMKTRPQGQMSQLKTQKSMNDLELYKELEGLGLDSDEPQMPVEKKLTEEEMKAQIKFWARAVASNVRQERVTPYYSTSCDCRN